MSRIAKKPIFIPQNVDLKIENNTITIVCNTYQTKHVLHDHVRVEYRNNKLFFFSKVNRSYGWMQAGTMRSLVNASILGITVGFTKKLILVGVGYRMYMEKNNTIVMLLGYSHKIQYVLPNDIVVENISATEITLKSINKQLLGQIAANIRSQRKPEVYKGKGVRYFNEFIRIKEAKKK
ncbi:50S ribosomal protein L6 [Buchnera aphidicola]|uniref:50S ribosomal protein L6 n=1 Tax=Buchnera aphidicola TaxID=9 RepID=UPI0031B7FE1B